MDDIQRLAAIAADSRDQLARWRAALDESDLVGAAFDGYTPERLAPVLPVLAAWRDLTIAAKAGVEELIGEAIKTTASDREIAAAAGVTHPLIARRRRTNTGNTDQGKSATDPPRATE